MGRYFASDLLPWLKDKLIAINAAELEYRKIATMSPGPSALWSIEGGAASGRMWDALAREILRTPMPAEFKKPGREADALGYRKSLDVTGPLIPDPATPDPPARTPPPRAPDPRSVLPGPPIGHPRTPILHPQPPFPAG